MKDLVRKLILDQWVMIQLLSTATKELARLSPSLTVSSSFWKRVSLCGLVNGKKKNGTELSKLLKLGNVIRFWGEAVEKRMEVGASSAVTCWWQSLALVCPSVQWESFVDSCIHSRK